MCIFKDLTLRILSYSRSVSVTNRLWSWWRMLEIQTGNSTVRCWWGPGRDRWTSAGGIRSWSGTPLRRPHTEYKGSKIVNLGCALQVNEKDPRQQDIYKKQCCRSMTFWCGSGSGDPCLWLMDPGSGSGEPCLWPMDPDPDTDPDPSIFIIDLQDANKKLIKKKVFPHITFWRYFYIIFQR